MSDWDDHGYGGGMSGGIPSRHAPMKETQSDPILTYVHGKYLCNDCEFVKGAMCEHWKKLLESKPVQQEGERELIAKFSDLAVELEKHSNDHIHDAIPDNLGAAVEGVCADRINAILKSYQTGRDNQGELDHYNVIGCAGGDHCICMDGYGHKRYNAQTPIPVPLAEKSKEELVRIVEMMQEDLRWYVDERNKLLAAQPSTPGSERE